MASEIAVKVGTKLTEAERQQVDRSEAERQQVDRSKAVTLQVQPSREAVQAQFGGMVALCPYCGGIGYGQEANPTLLSGYYICACCGLMFKM